MTDEIQHLECRNKEKNCFFFKWLRFFFDLTTFEISQQKKNIGVGIFQLEKVGKNEIEQKKYHFPIATKSRLKFDQLLSLSKLINLILIIYNHFLN